MAKISVDIECIKEGLTNIGYEISDVIERENNGINWQLKFSNSGAIITIYDSNKVNNTVVNGKLDTEEKENLKPIVEGLKQKELIVDPINAEIVEMIRTHKEMDYYDFKQIPHKNNDDLLHDIICLSNNIENKDAYLILGVTDDFEVVGVDDTFNSHGFFDFIKTVSFAGDHVPDIELKKLNYKCKTIYVVVCKSSKNVPFYLDKKFKKVNPNQIYTRVGDTNTPINGNANYEDVEALWRIHFRRENE